MMLKYLLIVTISCAACINRPVIKLVYPTLDAKNCKIAIELPADYEKLIQEQLQNNSLEVSKEFLYENDTLFLIKTIDSPTLSSIFITSEFLQIKKTPVPDSLANYIVRQYKYYKTEIENVKISPLRTKENVLVSKLSFKFSKENQYMVNYIFFVNNRSVTIGFAHKDDSKLIKFDNYISNLDVKCP